MRLLLCVIAILSLLLTTASACGGGEEPSPTVSPSVTFPGSATPPVSTPTATGEFTLTIDSIEATTVRLGDTVTVTFATRPRAVIGLQVVDGEGSLVVQDIFTAGSDGKAPFDFVAEGAAGQWAISAAAGATLTDLLRLQASPVPGPNTVDRLIEVR
jgi:hypothetical protein